MAAVVTQISPTAAFSANSGLRAAGVALELWQIVLTSPTTAATITANKITHPTATNYFLADDASVVTPTVAITPLGSGTSTIAATGLTTDKTYFVLIRGGR